MNGDVIGGISVLQRTKHDGIFNLIFIGYRMELKTSDRHIITIADKDFKVPENIGFPVWKFDRNKPRHGWLDCSPSVKISTTRPKGDKNVEVELFHNPFNWQTQYVEMVEPEPVKPDYSQNSDIRFSIRKVHYELNGGDLTAEQRAQVFEELRVRKIIF